MAQYAKHDKHESGVELPFKGNKKEDMFNVQVNVTHSKSQPHQKRAQTVC